MAVKLAVVTHCPRNKLYVAANTCMVRAVLGKKSTSPAEFCMHYSCTAVLKKTCKTVYR